MTIEKEREGGRGREREGERKAGKEERRKGKKEGERENYICINTTMYKNCEREN